MTKQQTSTTYTTSGTSRFNYGAFVVTYHVPDEVTNVKVVSGNASYNSTTRDITVNFGGNVSLDLTYGAIASGFSTTNASVTLNSVTTADGATTDAMTSLPFTNLATYNNTDNALNMLPLGGIAVDAPPTEINIYKGGNPCVYVNTTATNLFNIGFTRSVGVDFTNFSFDATMPDGMYVTSLDTLNKRMVVQTFSGVVR